MRKAMAMIELIFAIVIMAIAVMTIPSMMNIAANATKGMTIDEDVMSRMAGWTIDKFQARWDVNYAVIDSPVLWIAGVCNVANPSSATQCDPLNRAPGFVSGATYTNGDTSQGIERLNGGTETVTISPASGGNPYGVTATYSVSYVPDALLTVVGNVATTTWTIGSSGNMNPSPAGGATNLKRIVTRFNSPVTDLDVDTTLTFFKSNKGN